MVRGVVNARLEAIVNLTLTGPSGRMRGIEAVIDTGFTERLTLPPELATDLGLDFAGVEYLVLADGSLGEFEVFDVTVTWDGCPRHVLALASQGAPLVGMGLLHRHSLYVEVVEGGRVAVQATE